MEIVRLHEMLLAAGIEHEWRDRTPPGWKECVEELPHLFTPRNWGWQIIVYKPDGERLISAIEGWGTYGFNDGSDPVWSEIPSDLIEIMGLLTPEEAALDSVVGWLTAEDVFSRILKGFEKSEK